MGSSFLTGDQTDAPCIGRKVPTTGLPGEVPPPDSFFLKKDTCVCVCVCVLAVQGLSYGLWNLVPCSTIEPMPSAVEEHGVSTTGPPGMSYHLILFVSVFFVLVFFICIKAPLSFYTVVHGVLTGKYTGVVCLLTSAMDTNLG